MGRERHEVRDHGRFLGGVGLLLAGLLAAGGCDRKADLSRPFAMAMNGSEYSSRLANPVAYVEEMEAGFSTSLRYTVLFPLPLPTSMRKPGLQITLDPQRVVLGEEMTFQPGSERGVWIDYYPKSGHEISEGILLAFSSSHGEGSCTIRFDRLGSEIGGRVAGRLVRATLYGFKERAESAGIIPLREPRRLEIANFAFDVPLQRMEQAIVRRASAVGEAE